MICDETLITIDILMSDTETILQTFRKLISQGVPSEPTPVLLVTDVSSGRIPVWL